MHGFQLGKRFYKLDSDGLVAIKRSGKENRKRRAKYMHLEKTV